MSYLSSAQKLRAAMDTASTTTTNITVDLGSVSGSYYVGILCDGTGQIVTPRVWLE